VWNVAHIRLACDFCCDHHLCPTALPLAPADALSSSSSEFGSSAKDAATGLKAKAAIKDATSALPNTTATVADLNADVRNEASDYRDPAIATPQDKVQDKLAGERRRQLWCNVVLSEGLI
jgi:hypothetical protein